VAAFLRRCSWICTLRLLPKSTALAASAVGHKGPSFLTAPAFGAAGAVSYGTC